jgi:hypothetical protein
MRPLMAAENVLPFCRSWTFSDTGVLELKNFSQFVVISATAAELLPPVEVFAGAELAGADDGAGALEVAVDAGLLELLLQAAAVRASTRTSAGARVNRRAKSPNRMTRLPSFGQMYCRNAAYRMELTFLLSLPRMLPKVRLATRR